MRRSSDVLFASSNRHKFSEARDILDGLGIRLSFFPCSLQEIQSDSIGDISRHKARQAFELAGRPVLVEDDGLEIPSLGGFPGPYSSYVYDTIGNRGILDLVGADRDAFFVAVVTYCDGNDTSSFEARIPGRISEDARGQGWGYDPIFIPRERTRTFAESDDKNSVSHRHGALVRFSEWFARR